jgi:hypothetical protein
MFNKGDLEIEVKENWNRTMVFDGHVTMEYEKVIFVLKRFPIDYFPKVLSLNYYCQEGNMDELRFPLVDILPGYSLHCSLDGLSEEEIGDLCMELSARGISYDIVECNQETGGDISPKRTYYDRTTMVHRA